MIEADVLGRTPVLRRTTQQIHGRSTDNQDDDVLTVPSNNASLTATHFLAGGSSRVYCAKTEVAIRAQKHRATTHAHKLRSQRRRLGVLYLSADRPTVSALRAPATHSGWRHRAGPQRRTNDCQYPITAEISPSIRDGTKNGEKSNANANSTAEATVEAEAYYCV